MNSFKGRGILSPSSQPTPDRATVSQDDDEKVKIDLKSCLESLFVERFLTRVRCFKQNIKTLFLLKKCSKGVHRREREKKRVQGGQEKIKKERDRKREGMGQKLWRSWQSSRIQYQRSAVRIQSLAIFFTNNCNKNCIEKTKNKEKKARNQWPNF